MKLAKHVATCIGHYQKSVKTSKDKKQVKILKYGNK